jgi:outer membrane protein OmpA-like peptidoglycan-associated protein
MSAPPPSPQDTGAYRTRKRRGGALWWLWLLLLLLLALIIAGVVVLLVHHHDDNKKSGVAPAPTVSTLAPTGSGSPSAASSPSSASVPGSGAAAPLVGGGGIAPTPAVGTEASADTAGVVLFASNSATIDASGEQVIEAAATRLKAETATTVSVVGFTDIVAGTPTNDPLSRERAAAVAAKLRALLPGVTVTSSARGQADPVATNTTAAGRAQNRRAVISGS